jgi:hypothetical protein
MEIKVKKSVLFNVLKQVMTESPSRSDYHIGGNMGGNYLSFFSEDDEPIKPRPQMATQLSVEEPPVDDPDFVPASREELQAAAIRICKEVPRSEIEFFYRMLHKILDSALDKEDEKLFMLAEVKRILSESYEEDSRLTDSMKDAIKSAVVKAIRQRDPVQRFQAVDDMAKTIAGRSDFQEAGVDDIAVGTMIMDDIERRESIGFGGEQASSEPQTAVKTSPQIYGASKSSGGIKTMVRKAKRKDEPVEETFADVEFLPSFKAASDKDMYLKGYNDGVQDDTEELPAIPKQRDNADYVAGYEEGYASSGRVPSVEIVPEYEIRRRAEELYKSKVRQSVYDQMSKTQISELKLLNRLVFDSFDVLHDISQDAEVEAYNALLNKTVKDVKEAAKMVATEYGIGFSNSFTSVNLNKASSSEEKIKGWVSNFLTKLSKGFNPLSETYKKRLSDLNSEITKAAKLNKIEVSDVIDFIASSMAAHITLDKKRNAQLPKDEFLNKVVSDMFMTVITDKSGLNFQNGLHFNNNIEMEQQPQVESAILDAFVEKNLKGDEYVFNNAGVIHSYPADEFKLKVEEVVNRRFKEAQKFQEDKAKREEEKSLSSVEVDEDIAEEAIDQRAKDKFLSELQRLADTREYETLAPFFGFSNANGIRQWYNKHVKKKFEDAVRGVKEGQDSPMFEKMRQMQEAIVPYIIDAIDFTKEATEAAKKKAKKPADQEEHDYTIDILDHIKGQMAEYNDFIADVGIDPEDADDIEKATDYAYTVSGYIVRQIVGDMFSNITSIIDREARDYVAELVKDYLDFDKIEANKKKKLNDKERSKIASSVAEYFTGTKEVPSYAEMGKTAEKLIEMGIDAETYAEVADVVKDWFEDTIDTGFMKVRGATKEEDFIGQFVGEIDKVFGKVMAKGKSGQRYTSSMLLKAIDAYKQDMASQVAMSNLSDYEVV